MGVQARSGISYNLRRKWYTDVYGGVVLPDFNASVYPGTAHRQQDPLPQPAGPRELLIARRSAARWTRPCLGWRYANENGGRSRVAWTTSESEPSWLSASRPASRSSSCRLETVRVGDDFGTAAVAYQVPLVLITCREGITDAHQAFETRDLTGQCSRGSVDLRDERARPRRCGYPRSPDVPRQ